MPYTVCLGCGLLLWLASSLSIAGPTPSHCDAEMLCPCVRFCVRVCGLYLARILHVQVDLASFGCEGLRVNSADPPAQTATPFSCSLTRIVTRYDSHVCLDCSHRQATTWVKRESEQKYKADFAAGRTLGGKKKVAGMPGLPGGWGAAFSGLSGSKAGGGAAGKGGSAGGWLPSWMKAAEPEPEPEPEIVEAVRRQQQVVLGSAFFDGWVGGAALVGNTYARLL